MSTPIPPDPVPNAATSTVQPDPLGPWPGEVAWRPVSPKLVLQRELQLAVGVVPLAALGVGVWLSFGTAWAALYALLAVAFLVVRAVLIVRAVRSWGYAERVDDLLVRHGLLVRRLSIVPYGRMQFVDVSAGPVERLFGLATVQLHTAAAATDARIPGLEPTEAARLRDRLAALGEAQAEGL